MSCLNLWTYLLLALVLDNWQLNLEEARDGGLKLFWPWLHGSFSVEVFENFDIDALTDELMSLFLLGEDPKTYQEAMRSIDTTFWKELSLVK